MITNQPSHFRAVRVLQLLRFHMIIALPGHMIRVDDCRQSKKNKDSLRVLGADSEIRTHDLLITSEMLYRLSYTSLSRFVLRVSIVAKTAFVNP